eukprot:136765-Hanusia_phi.AAC.3
MRLRRELEQGEDEEESTVADAGRGQLQSGRKRTEYRIAPSRHRSQCSRWRRSMLTLCWKRAGAAFARWSCWRQTRKRRA